MSGLSGFRREPGVRRLPRLGTTGGHSVLVSVPRLPGRRSRGAARFGPGRGVVSWKVFTTWALVGRTLLALWGMALRPAAPALLAPPRRRHRVRRPAARHWGAARRPCRRPADNVPGAPSRGAGKAAASSRCALPSRRASVVSTVSASERVETTRESSGCRNYNSLHDRSLRTSYSAQTAFWGRNARKRRVQNG